MRRRFRPSIESLDFRITPDGGAGLELPPIVPQPEPTCPIPLPPIVSPAPPPAGIIDPYQITH